MADETKNTVCFYLILLEKKVDQLFGSSNFQAEVSIARRCVITGSIRAVIRWTDKGVCALQSGCGSLRAGMKGIRPAFFTSSFLHSPFRIARAMPPVRTKAHATVATLRPNVAVVGGGFGGLATALSLEALPWTRLTRPQITLIDKSERFAFLPMLYELATNEAESWEVAPPFVDLLQDTSIKFVRADVDAIDASSGVVEGTTSTGNGMESVHVPFDRAVISIGAECANIDAVPGAKEFALPFYTLNDALRLREKLRHLMDRKQTGENVNVFVVGGGFSGIELASCIAEKIGSRGSVVVLERGDGILSAASEHNRATSEKALEARGVTVETGTSVTQISSDSISVQTSNRQDGAQEPRAADLILWTAGSKPSTRLQSFGLPLDARNKLLTDEFLQVRGHEDLLFALGDAATVEPNQLFSGTAQVAAQQADYAAWNIWASLTDRSKLKYRYTHLGEMMVLGAKDASVSSSVGLDVSGTSAWTVRRAAYMARMPSERHRLRVAASWAADPLLREISKAAAKAGQQGGMAS